MRDQESMRSLSAQKISGLIAEIHRGDPGGKFNGTSLHTIAARFRSTHAALVRNSNSNERDRIFSVVGFDESRLRDMISKARLSGLPFLDSTEFPAGRAFTLSDIPKDRAVSKRDMRDRFLYSHRDRQTLIGMVASGPSHQSLVWFSRENEAGQYRQEDKDELELFLPHLCQATELSDHLTDLHMQLDTSSQVLNRAPFGMFFLNSDGVMLHGNRRAYDILGCNDGLRIRDGKLTVRFEEPRKQLDVILQGIRNSPATDGGGREKLSVKRSSGENPYLMMIVPMRLKPSSGLLHGGRVVLIQVHDPSGIGKAKVDGLEKYYNLTAAEAEVCRRLYETKCLSGVAKELGVSVNTAKTHLIRSFRKIGVSSQAELLQQLAVHPKEGW
jgi:DNA-binding CsgD family transcriptional regulator/PAS domain-containing protein